MSRRSRLVARLIAARSIVARSTVARSSAARSAAARSAAARSAVARSSAVFSIARRSIAALSIASAIACRTGATPEPGPTSVGREAPVERSDAPGSVDASTSTSTASISTASTSIAPAVDPTAATATSAAESGARPSSPAAPAPPACRHGERLDDGCSCEGMVPCFDLCCAAGSGCAHPATPGGPSACMLSPNPPPRPCKDGEPLDTGCACVDGGHCMDLCCVGSACSHASSPDGGSAKCVKIPKRR